MCFRSHKHGKPSVGHRSLDILRGNSTEARWTGRGMSWTARDEMSDGGCDSHSTVTPHVGYSSLQRPEQSVLHSLE